MVSLILFLGDASTDFSRLTSREAVCATGDLRHKPLFCKARGLALPAKTELVNKEREREREREKRGGGGD